MKKLVIFFVSFCALSTAGIAQKNGIPVTIGNLYTISSKVINEDRSIQVYLPDGYENSNQSYPVLYILDGQRFFSNGVAIQQALRSPIAIPDMIVVGINSVQSKRRSLFGNTDQYTAFIKQDVISFIDGTYRTTSERVIFGWEAAAYYISEMILKEKKLFSGAIITDGGYAPEALVKDFKSDEDVYLYMTNSKRDIFYVGSSDAFNEILRKHNPKNLKWTYELFNDEVHQSMPYLGLYKGLRYYYHNYDAPIFESIEAYTKAGGMSYLKSYFKERVKRFGGDGKISKKTKDALIWLAWNKDDFKHFSLFMDTFKEVLTTKRYASAYWQHRFGAFYLKHKDYKNAVTYFERGLKKYPNTRFDAPMKEGLQQAKNNL